MLVNSVRTVDCVDVIQQNEFYGIKNTKFFTIK